MANTGMRRALAVARGFSPWPASLKARIIAGFALGVLMLAVVTAASASQQQVHRDDIRRLESHSKIASDLQGAEAEGAIAAMLLQRYVTTGDEYLVTEIEGHAAAAVEHLTSVIAYGHTEGRDLAVEGSNLARGAAEVVALRQRGNTEAAVARLEEIVPVFRQFRLQLQDATAEELGRVSEMRSSADRAGKIALWLLIISGLVGSAAGLAVSVIIARSILLPLASLEATAMDVSRGDMAARAHPRGPRELEQLGSALNMMMATVEERTTELRRANKVLRERNRQLTSARTQAATDPLTGLGNHRSFHRRIRAEIARAEQKGGPLGLVLFDLDGFKAINDTLGHQAGDEIMRELSLLVQTLVRAGDAYRYGGDEFAVVAQGADIRQTTRLAERLRLAFCEKEWSHQGRLTVSLGVASFPEMGATAEEVVYRADMAMYWAKSTGKNRVGDWDGLISRRSGDGFEGYIRGRGILSHDSIAGLTAALASKDPGTRDHIERCSWYAARLADELGLNDAEKNVVRLAALLHDVGKLAIPAEILCKPGPLDDDEWRQMRLHPCFGLYMLNHIESVAEAVPAILHHHEHFDGSGYPDGLAGADIPIASRILMVCDAFDAMTTDRPYRPAMPERAAVEELLLCRGKQFDPEVVDAFLRMLSREGAHPLRGSASEVPLGSGEEAAPASRQR